MSKPEFEIDMGDILLGVIWGLFLGGIFYFFYFYYANYVVSDDLSFIPFFSFLAIKFLFFSMLIGVLISLFIKRSRYNTEMLEYFEEIKSEEDNIRRQKIEDEEFRKIQEIKDEELRKKQQIYNEKLRISIAKINSQFDSNNNGVIELVDGDSFKKLLHKNQQKIIEIDKNYIQNFVKISIYLNTKKENTQKIFVTIKDTKNITELNELVGLLKNQIHAFEVLVFHSINMITSLVESDLVTFYEIYECFDQLGVFNSNWQNEISNKLTNIGERIRDLMYSIHQMEINIIGSLANLSYVNEESFKELNVSVNRQLSSIDSTIKFNNLLTVIQTYQMYKINQNTKRIG
jgi:hypothetical protein